ncbi:uncharacterized protein LOC135383124 [Ornithodoros turicata]|uniref:uncharacterized protein LOC135383124 n=1 Tax=Ornithodoros turicata TaxID=34597 RepID=UPI0031399AC0
MPTEDSDQGYMGATGGQPLSFDEVKRTGAQTYQVSHLCTNCAAMHAENNALRLRVAKLERQNGVLQKKPASMDCQKPIFWQSSPQLSQSFPHHDQPFRIPGSSWPWFFMVLMKLRLHTPFQDLAYRFHVTPKTLRKAFDVWLRHPSQIAKELVAFPRKLREAGSRIKTLSTFQGCDASSIAVKCVLQDQQTWRRSRKPGAITSNIAR